MKERADFVGSYIHDNYHGGGRAEVRKLMGEAQAAYRNRGERRNPSGFGADNLLLLGAAAGGALLLIKLLGKGAANGTTPPAQP